MTTNTADDVNASWDCPACEDGSRRVYPEMFQTDPDDIDAQCLDDRAAKQYFDYPLAACPVCGRPSGGQP